MNKARRILLIPLMLTALALQLVLCGCSMPVIACFTDRSNSPEHCYEQFVRCMANDRYAEAESYILNYETLGFTAAPEDPFSTLIFDALSKSRSGRVLNKVSDRGYKVTLEVEYTTLDLRLIEPALSEATSTLVYDTQYAGIEVSSSDQYEDAMIESLRTLLEQPQNYYRTAVFSLDFELKDGEWKIISTEDFYSALIGYSL